MEDDAPLYYRKKTIKKILTLVFKDQSTKSIMIVDFCSEVC
jgi:hypothetical protein